MHLSVDMKIPTQITALALALQEIETSNEHDDWILSTFIQYQCMSKLKHSRNNSLQAKTLGGGVSSFLSTSEIWFLYF